MGFAGTPAFAACALAAIHRHGCTIPLVLTQPDRPFGRGLAVAPSPVKRYATGHGLPVRQPESLKPDATQSALRETLLDVLVVAAYGLILPPTVLGWPRYGGLNIHASLLPRWRGAAPIVRAIEAGDATTGITIMQMDAGLDSGPIVSMEAIPIHLRETAGTLHDRLARLGAAMIVDALDTLVRDGRLPATPQPAQHAIYAAKLTHADSLIDWTQAPDAIDRRVRALAPAPGAVAGWQGKPVKVRAALPLISPGDAAPGTVLAVGGNGVDVACGNGTDRGVLRVTELQPAGGRAMPADAFAAGYRVTPGARFEPGR